ncbi:MAG: hypothetical protein P4M08_12150 [Oligoflexia bacterium]|nr:hypothetical protein [Oligoflexia bacterium]
MILLIDAKFLRCFRIFLAAFALLAFEACEPTLIGHSVAPGAHTPPTQTSTRNIRSDTTLEGAGRVASASYGSRAAFGSSVAQSTAKSAHFSTQGGVNGVR